MADLSAAQLLALQSPTTLELHTPNPTFRVSAMAARDVASRMLAKIAIHFVRAIRAVAALYAVLSAFGLLVAIALHVAPSAALAETASASPYTLAVQGTAFAVSVCLVVALRLVVNNLYRGVRPGEQLLRSNWQI